MTCGKYWESNDGQMFMHDMTDQHVINAYRRMEDLHENPIQDIYQGSGDWEIDIQSEAMREDISDRMADLEGEAERRWGPGDGEALIRERMERGVRNVPRTPINLRRTL